MSIINTNRPRSGLEPAPLAKTKVVSKEPCPECRKRGLDTAGDNLNIFSDGHSHCFACGYHNGIAVTDTEFSYEYLPWRGISSDTFRFYDCKTKIDQSGKPNSIGYLYPNGSVKVRQLDKKSFHSVGDIGKAGLFGRNKFAAGSNKTLIITEGELDALSIYQVVRTPVVSVHSAASCKLDVGIDRSWCNSFEKIVLAFDNDEAGREAARQAASLFDYKKVYMVSFAGGDRKDANDYVRHNESDQLATIVSNARRYLPETIVSSFSDFDKILSERPKEGIPYPFPTWTFMTYGIRPGESVLITAQEGVGKTEVMRAIEYQLLRETNDPVGVIFLEENKQRHLQSLAGLHLRVPAHLPDSGVADAELATAVRDTVRSDDRLHLYSHFGSDDPDSILDTIRFMVAGRGCRYVLLDHLTIVVSGLGGENERQALDYLSTRLEMMVKELDFSLIVVSHVNDDGKTRGSRNISKIADIRIDLDRDLTSPDPTIRRTIHSKISKNRYCGRTGPSGSLLFDPLSNTLSEDMYGQVSAAANDNTSRYPARVA